MKKAIVGVLILAAVLWSQEDIWQGIDPHQVPHCDMPARAARNPENTAPCHCVGMVAEVQESLGSRCWADHSPLPLPRDEEESLRVRRMILGSDTAPKELVECLKEVPDHCPIVARGPHAFGVSTPNTCRTQCKPERCGCKDGSCPAHGEGAYY